MGMASKMVAAYFESKEIKVREIEEDILRAGWDFKGGSMSMYFFFEEDDAHVHMEGMNFVKIPEDKFDDMYKVVNSLNNTYKHFTFVLLEDKEQIVIRDDAIIQLDSCGEECFELMFRMLNVVEDAYPVIMKALYA